MAEKTTTDPQLYRSITLRFPPELYDKICEFANAWNLTKTEVVRRALSTRMLDGLVEYQMRLEAEKESVLKEGQKTILKERSKFDLKKLALADKIVEKLKRTRYKRSIAEAIGIYHGKPLRTILSQGE